MLLFWLTTDVIVHQSSNKELELSQDLVDGALIGSFLNLALQDVVHLDDLLICISEVVFAPVAVWHCHRWSNWRWSNCEVLYDHPLRLTKLFAESHQLEIFISHLSENLIALISVENLLPVFGLIEIFVEVLNIDGEALLYEFWLLVAASTCLRVTQSTFFRSRVVVDIIEFLLRILALNQKFVLI